MLSPNKFTNEISNDSGKHSAPSSLGISEAEEEVFDTIKGKNTSDKNKEKGEEVGDGFISPSSPGLPPTNNVTNTQDLHAYKSMAANEGLQKQLTWMQKNLDMLKKENLALEKAASGQSYLYRGAYNPSFLQPQALPQSSYIRPISPTFALSNYKVEMATLKSELTRISNQLEMCELGRKSFSDRWVNRLQTSLGEMNMTLRQLLGKKLGNPVETALMDSIQSRLRGTEERLKRNRKEMLETLSSIENTLLSENAQYKMSEAEVRRNLKQRSEQLQTVRRKHQNLTEMFQRLKIKSSENGIIDIKEMLKKYSIEELDGEGSKEGGEQDTVLEEIKKENKNQIGLLIKEKSSLSSQMAEVTDESHLNRLENEKLKKSLSDLSMSWKLEVDEFKQNQNVVLQRVLSQMEEFNKEAQGLCRCDHQALTAVKVLEDTLDTQDRLLTTTLAELDQLKATPPPPINQKPQSTTASIQTQPLQPEQQRVKVKPENSNMRAILEFMKVRSSDDYNKKPLASKNEELPSPMADVQGLHDKVSKLEVDLEFSQKNLAFQKELSVKLQHQVSGYQEDLRKRNQMMEMGENNEKDLQREMTSYKQVFKELQEDLAEKDKELKLLQADKGSVQRLLERDRMDVGGKEGDDAAKTADIEFIKQALELDIMSSRNTLDNSLKENNRLKLSLDQAIRELANERDLTSSATYDKMMMQQQLYSVEQERDNEAKEKERLSTENSLLQLENDKLNSGLQAKHNLNLSSATAADKQLKSSVKKLTAELEHTKNQLDAKEKELSFLQDTLKFMLNNNSKDTVELPSTSSS